MKRIVAFVGISPPSLMFYSCYFDSSSCDLKRDFINHWYLQLRKGNGIGRRLRKIKFSSKERPTIIEVTIEEREDRDKSFAD
jgi:hypothetical protein